MQQVLPGIHASEPMTPSFAPRSSVRAYLVERPDGNLLLYATDAIAANDPDVQALGGIARVLLSHWNEAGFGAGEIGAPVHVSDKGWKFAILPESDRETYLDSLAMLRDLEFDVLIPSFAPVGAPFYQRLTKQEWQDGIDTLVTRIKAGQNF